MQISHRGDLSGKIMMLQPQGLAAKKVTLLLAEKPGERSDQTVGQWGRNKNGCGPATQLEVVTEGILNWQLQQDSVLDGVWWVILDEFHERSLQADLALALDVQRGLQDDLKMLIICETLDDRRLTQLFPPAPMIRAAERRFPVDRPYQAASPQTGMEEAIAGAVQ